MESLYFSLTELNPLLECSLCKGYLVDPYTIKECMHAFCRTCILLYFEKPCSTAYKCPKCQTSLQPFSDLSKCLLPDRQLGDLVQSLLPSLSIDEINNEKQFYEQRSMTIPNDLRLKLRLVEHLSPMRSVDQQGQTRLCSQTSIAINNGTIPVALKIELCRKYIDPSASLHRSPRKYLCLNSQLHIEHVRKYIETITQIAAPFRVFLFFYDSCLKDSTPLLLIKSLLFPSTDRLKLFFSIMPEQ